MGREPSSLPGGGLVVRRQHSGSRVVVTLAGSLELDGVEQLAACADQICRSTVRAAVFDVTAVTAVDDAGARTLSAACRCLVANGIEAEVDGIAGEFRRVLDRLDLALPEFQTAVSAERAETMPAGAAPMQRPRPAGAVLGR